MTNGGMNKAHRKDFNGYFKYLDQKEIKLVTFLDYCAELWFDSDHRYIRFISETFIKTPEGEFQIPSERGNWFLYRTLGQEIQSIEFFEKYALVKIGNGYEITVDTYMGGVTGDSIMMRFGMKPTMTW